MKANKQSRQQTNKALTGAINQVKMKLSEKRAMSCLLCLERGSVWRNKLAIDMAASGRSQTNQAAIRHFPSCLLLWSGRQFCRFTQRCFYVKEKEPRTVWNELSNLSTKSAARVDKQIEQGLLHQEKGSRESHLCKLLAEDKGITVGGKWAIGGCGAGVTVNLVNRRNRRSATTRSTQETSSTFL